MTRQPQKKPTFTTLKEYFEIRQKSLKELQEIYDLLGVLLTPQDVRGESFYHLNGGCDAVIADLKSKEMLVKSAKR